MATSPVVTTAAPGSARPEPGRTRRAPLPVAAAVAALWAAIVTYGSILALASVGAIGSSGTPGGVARLAASGWLLSHGVPLQTPTHHIALVPLAIAALVAWRLYRAGVHASRAIGGHRSRSVRRALGAGAAVAVVYAGLGAGVAALARTVDLTVTPQRAGVTMGLFAAVAAMTGAVGHSHAGRTLARRAPSTVSGALRTGVVAAAFIIAAGAAAAGVALAIRGGDAGDMLGSYRAGLLGQAGITALCLAYLPNLAVWGAAYLLGPGFAVGADTLVSPGEVLLGPVPALPVLAGLPSAPLAGAGPALLGIPLVAGMFAGWLLARRSGTVGWASLIGAAILAGPVAGAVMQMVSFAAAGALGSGRLAVMGSVDWRISLFATVVVTVGAALGAAVSRTLAGPRP